jgi:hypothetical protein
MLSNALWFFYNTEATEKDFFVEKGEKEIERKETENDRWFSTQNGKKVSYRRFSSIEFLYYAQKRTWTPFKRYLFV